MSFAEDVIRVIRSSMEKIQRPDLFRKPICGFSAADDPRYKELKTVIGPWHCLPTELLPEAKTVISYYVPFTKEVAKAPKNGGNLMKLLIAPLILWGNRWSIFCRSADIRPPALRRLIPLIPNCFVLHGLIGVPLSFPGWELSAKIAWSSRRKDLQGGFALFLLPLKFLRLPCQKRSFVCFLKKDAVVFA